MTKLLVFVLLLLTATSAVAQGQSSNPPRTKPGAITGTVVNENGQPLQNVVVYVRAFSSTRVLQAAVTDSEGKFEVTGLEPQTYQVLARHTVYSLRPREDGAPNQYHVGDSVRLVMAKGGVITGTVTTRTGEPVIGVRVRVTPVPNGDPLPERSTDDRGVYRIYGLPGGKYLVSAGGGGGFYTEDPYDVDIPTYSPASTRDTAAEITVRLGEETPNVDIRYRGEPGHIVSGTVSNSPTGFIGVLVSLSSGEGGSQMNAIGAPQGDGFIIYGIDDGDYTIIARTMQSNGEWLVSQPQRISIRGADITGIELALKSLASFSGQVVLEELKTKDCGTREAPVISETLVSAWHRPDEAAKAMPSFVWGMGTPASADGQGNFKLQNLAPSDYYFVARFPAKTWYLKSVSLTSAAAKKVVDATRVWTTVKSSERISGLKITLAEGAASLNGQVALAEGEGVPEKLSVYLVPAEKESSDEVLRFYATEVNPEGKIALTNLAPGRYWLLLRPALEGGLTKLRLPDATEARTNLRREAEEAKTEIELKPCQNVADYRLKLGRG